LDFKIIKIIGKGSFGKILLVQKLENKEYYAIKCMRKDIILEYEKVTASLMEKTAMEEVKHPFLVNINDCFQTQDRIYFVMKFVRGGQLFTHLKLAQRFSEERSKCYAMQIALALGHIHKINVVYRDLKLENILVGEDGYLNLVDFGICKRLQKNEVTKSLCGTPEYLSPEMLNQEGHSFQVDWWTLGIVIYEMLVGLTPFYTGL